MHYFLSFCCIVSLFAASIVFFLTCHISKFWNNFEVIQSVLTVRVCRLFAVLNIDIENSAALLSLIVCSNMSVHC